jgi:hypothetical protein
VYGFVCSRFSKPRANDERNKEYSVPLVGPELNIYITKTYGTTNIKFTSEGKDPTGCDKVCSFIASTCFEHQYAHHQEYN